MKLASLALSFSLTLTATTSLTDAQVIFVNANQSSGLNDGSSWADAFQGEAGLQLALQAAATGDQIYVAAGTYRPTQDMGRAKAFRLRSGVSLYGGFVGGEASPDDRPAFESALTILDGDLADNDSSGDLSDNSYHVVRVPQTDDPVLLDRFWIQGGNANDSNPNLSRDTGGGLFGRPGSTGTIRDCVFSSNRASWSGGGLALFQSALVIEGCTFEGNTAGNFGGGLSARECPAADIQRCRLVENQSEAGSAMLIQNSTGILVAGCILANNTATGSARGGALLMTAGQPGLIANCTIVDNVATQSDHAGIGFQQPQPEVVNCILWGNVGQGGSQQGFNQVSPLGSVTYSIVQGGIAGAGNSAQDPMLLPETNLLSLLSPAIDAGDNAGIPSSVMLDFTGSPRFLDQAGIPDTGSGSTPIADIGAHEFSDTQGAEDPGCVPLPNSTGSPSVLTAAGSLTLSSNDAVFAAGALPANQFGYMVMSQTTASTPLGSGVLCLGSPLVRFRQDVLNTASSGGVLFALDNQDLPAGLTFQSGETWIFQLWHRDVGGTSNLTNSLAFTWQ